MGRYRRARLRDGEAGGATPTAVKGTLVLTQSAVTLRAFTLSTRAGLGVVGVSNGGPGSLRGPSVSIAYGSGSGWLTATVESVAGGWDIELEGNASALAVATYTATVTVTDAGASDSGETFDVSFIVEGVDAATALQYATMDSFDAALGATASTPASDTVTISNRNAANGSVLFGPYVENVDVDWVSAAITGTGPTWSLTITGTASIADLASGRHFGTVRVNDAYGGSADLTVLIDIAGAAGTPALQATPNALAFSADEGGASPADQTSTLTNVGGGGALAGPTASVVYSGTDTGWCTPTVSGTGPSYTLTVACATGSLPAGRQTANVVVADANCTQTIGVAVTFDVVPSSTTQPILNVSPPPRAFGYTIGGTVPADQTATISNVGTGALVGPSATSDVTWCQSIVTGTGPTWSLAFRAVQSGLQQLAAGVHQGTVTVADAAASSVQIPVTVQVSSLTPGTFAPPRVATCEGVIFNSATGFLEGVPTGVRRTPPSNLTAAATATPATAAALAAAITASASQDHPVIELAAGATLTAPGLAFPPRTGAGVLVLRSSGYADFTQGTRVDPVADAASLVTLQTTSGTPIINQRTTNAGGGVWVEGIRFTGTAANGNSLVNTRCQTESDDANLTRDVYFAHCHFDGIRDVVRAIQWGGIRMGVYDSYADGFEKVGQECQAILLPLTGQYYFADNSYLQGNGECFMAGGVALPANLNRYVPRDLYFRWCHFDTLPEWNPQHPSYNGTSAGYKNLFELKRGLRVTVDGCYFEHSFPDAQTGQPIVIKSVCQGALNQSENRTEDVLFHLCLFRDNPRHGWESLGNSGAKGGEQPAARIQFLDCLAFETNIHPYDMTTSVSWTLGATNDTRDYSAEHCTLAMSGGTNPSQASSVGAASNVTIRGCIIPQGTYGMSGTGTSEGIPSMDRYWIGYTVTENILYGGSSSINYPQGNYFPASEAAVGFVNPTGTSPADYKLSASSAYANVRGADGRPLGADVDRVITRTTGVY